MRTLTIVLAVAVVVVGLLIRTNLEADGAIRRFYPKPNYSVSQIPSQKGRVALITGANVGLGKETAVQLARKGAKVILGCRSSCQSVVDSIKKEGGDALALPLDLSDSASIYRFATEFRRLNLPIHMLILNAGVMMIPTFTTTKDGLESQIGVNWIGHFYLQHLLQDIVEASAPSRVVILTSKGHEFAPVPMPETIPVQDTPASREQYNAITQYAYSKLMNLLHAKELDARMREQGKKVIAIAVHPGAVDTELARYIFDFVQPYVGGTIVGVLKSLAELFVLSVHDGALTQLWAATSPQVEKDNLGGAYAVPIGQTKEPSANARDAQLRKRAWAFGEEIIRSFPK
jgi:NAD(P)-dependent dehydrogenase (short-subunit alcohol dehydrogenase family)